jgi:hypothetical protein
MFFEDDRKHFFRPLSNKRREAVAACLRALYERLHGPSADYSQSMTRDNLRELFLPVIQSTQHGAAAHADAGDLPGSALDAMEPVELAKALVRELANDGWLEDYPDKVGLVTAYRFTRAGKLFAHALWTLDRPGARSRQRNMRSCRNSLDAVVRRNGDAFDLLDAYEYAENVISDLAEGVDYFQELVRRLMQEASRTPWDEFMEFLGRFEREFKKQLTADNAERHRQAIRETVWRLRALERARLVALEAQLDDIARWAAAERNGDSTLEWMLERIEEMVEAACRIKQPELIRAMGVYIRRAASIVQQATSVRAGAERHAYLTAIARLAALPPEEQDGFLARVGEHIGNSAVRLLDPESFRLRGYSQRRKAVTLQRKPVITREARLEAAIKRAQAGAFALSNDDVLTDLRRQLRAVGRPVRLSTLPMGSAMDVLTAMQAVEAVRASRDGSLAVRRLPGRMHTPFYDAHDYEIEMKADADRIPE